MNSKANISARRVHDFHGGIHPPENKLQSLGRAIQSVPLPDLLVIPLSQHIGNSAVPCVAPGERVLGGQCIAAAEGFVSVPCHAPTSGTVIAIEERPIAHPSGLPAPCVVLEPDGKDEWLPLAGCADFRQLSPRELAQRIQSAGISGMGGAGFPTAVKLSPAPGKQIHTLIINGTECEPYITADDMLMRECADAIVSGAAIIAHVLGVSEVLIGVEDNKPEALASLREACAGSTMEVVSFPTKYPSGGEKQLIELLLGRQVPSGGIPADIGVVCQNVGTAAAVHDAVIRGIPLVSRVTTVTGNAVQQPGNYRVLIGTPMRHLLANAGLRATAASRLVMGGPMMGFSVPDPQAPVIKTTNCLLVPTANELPPPPPAQACIRCGLCAEACPASLLPQQLYWFAQGKEHDKLERHHLFDCIECGACAYVCPSHIPLVQYYRASKADIISQRREAAKSEHARERFEARQARLERLAAEKEAKRAERKRAAEAKAKAAVAASAAPGAKEQAAAVDPIQAAIERAQARKAAMAEQQAAQASGEGAKGATDALQAAVDTARKRLEKAREKLAAADPADETLSAALRTGVQKSEQKLAQAEQALREAKA